MNATQVVVNSLDFMSWSVPFVPLLSVGSAVVFAVIVWYRSFLFAFLLCLLLRFVLLLFLQGELCRLYH